MKIKIIDLQKKEIELLKQYYSIGDWESIYKLFPNVNKCSIYTKMSKLNVCMDDYFWSEDDVLKLKELYPNIGNNTKELVKLFNNKYTHSAILTKAQKLGLKTREFWTDEEISLLIENYHKKTLDELMILLPNRKRDRIIAKANSLHLLNKCKYQPSEIEFIINNWKNMSDTEMSDYIGRPSHSIRDKRLSLGLLRLKEESSYNDLSEYIRRNNLEWKTQSMASCGYKCILTGDRFDDIHHIYGLNLILNETLVELGIEIKLSMDDYTEEELRDILDVFRIKQSKYPLGVCLSKNIHTLFHNKYGYGNNTQEQWNEFVVDFKDGKYNEFLNVA